MAGFKILMQNMKNNCIICRPMTPHHFIVTHSNSWIHRILFFLLCHTQLLCMCVLLFITARIRCCLFNFLESFNTQLGNSTVNFVLSFYTFTESKCKWLSWVKCDDIFFPVIVFLLFFYFTMDLLLRLLDTFKHIINETFCFCLRSFFFYFLYMERYNVCLFYMVTVTVQCWWNE